MKSGGIIIAIVGLVIVVGLVMWFAMMNKSEDKMALNSAQNENMVDQNSSEGVMVGGALMTPDKDIVDNAVNSKDHTTVVAAVKAAGLVDTLKGAGPFTVFAPTNAAFEMLPAGTVESLLMPENKEKLTGVLTYHVVPGAYRAADITDGLKLKTVNGQEITFTQKDGAWYINDSAKITIADVVSSNGVTHVVDAVLLPM